MKLLALETGSPTASVAVVDGGKPLAHHERTVTTHSDVLLVLIDRALADAGLPLSALDGVAIGAGPGSFTGLRIGMATAKGLCFAADLPLWTVSSLAALACDAAAAPGSTVLAALDARRGEVFAGAYRIADGGEPAALADEAVLPPDRLADYAAALDDPIVLGSGAHAYPDAIAGIGRWRRDARATPSARASARTAQTVGRAARNTAIPPCLTPLPPGTATPLGLLMPSNRLSS